LPADAKRKRQLNAQNAKALEDAKGRKPDL
jgi:hypothetical protein